MTHGHPGAAGRRLRLAGLVVVATALVAGVAVGVTRVRIDTGMSAFLPNDDPTTQELAQKADDFGGDPVIALLESPEPRALFSDHDQLMELLKLEGALARLDDVAAVYGPATVLNQTAGAAQGMLAQLSGGRDGYRRLAVASARQKGLPRAKVKAAGRKAAAAFDKRYGTLLVQAMPAGLPTLTNPKFVHTVLFDEDGNPRARWHFVVPTPSSVAILVRPRAHLDQADASRLTAQVRAAIKESGLSLSRTTVTGVPALEAALADRASREAVTLGLISLGSVGLVFVLSGWTRRRRSRLRPVLSAVAGTAITLALYGWFGHDLSFGVVAFLPILLGIGSDFPLYLSRGGRDRATLVAALAAAAGFGSLLLSPLPFVHQFGIALGVGLMATIAVSLLLRRVLGPVPPATYESAVVVRGGRRPLAVPLRATLALLVVGAAVAGWVALPGLTVQAQPERLARGLPEMAAASYAEDMLHSSGEVNIVLRGDNVATPEALAWGARVEDQLIRNLGGTVRPVISVADLFRFLGDRPTPDQIQAAVQLMPPYLTSAVLRSDQKESVIVLGVQFDDVGQLATTLRQIEAAVADPPDGIRASVVGLPVASARGLELISEGRLWMNLAGIAAAGLVLLIGLRRRQDAVRAVLTIGLATGWVALAVAATTGALNPLTVAVGSLITATGCEFAVMLGGGRTPVRSVATAALAATVGFLVIGLSELAVLRDFGLLLAGGVVASFVSALLVTRVLVPERVVPAPAVPTRSAIEPDREELLV